MPEICRFYGIVIAIYHNDHPPPHFHIRYSGHKAKMAIDDFRILDGTIPPRARALAAEWAAAHREELLRNWTLAQAQQPLVKVAPLQ